VTARLRSPWTQPTVWRWPGPTAQDVAELSNSSYLALELAAGQELVYAPTRANLAWPELLRRRQGESARARCRSFADGMLVWLGKAEPHEYYTALDRARRGARAGPPTL
jgi:hypothetical protein